MSKKLVCVLVTAILALSGVAGADSTFDDSTEVSALMGAHIWIDAPTSVTLNLAPETTATNAPNVNVKTNKDLDWTVTAYTNMAEGKLLYGSIPLSTALSLTTTEEGTISLTTSAQKIYDDPEDVPAGNPSHKTGGQQRQIPVTFGQYSTYDDVEGTYTGVVTFTAGYK